MLGRVKGDVQRPSRHTEYLDVDATHAQRLRPRSKLFPKNVGGSADTDQRAMKIDGGVVRMTQPRLRIHMSLAQVTERAESERPERILRQPGHAAGDTSRSESLYGRAAPSSYSHPAIDGPLEQQRSNPGIAQRCDHLGGDGIDRKGERRSADAWRQGKNGAVLHLG